MQKKPIRDLKVAECFIHSLELFIKQSGPDQDGMIRARTTDGKQHGLFSPDTLVSPTGVYFPPYPPEGP